MPTILRVDGFEVLILLPPREHEPAHVNYLQRGGSIMVSRPTEAEIRAQIPAARTLATAEREAGFRAAAARYDRKTGRFVLELTNGYQLGIPVSTLPALRDTTPTQLAAVELSATGSAIRIPVVDADYSVPGLVLSLTAREIGRRGGQARSKAKSRAAKVNGAKGGRPRKLTGA